MTQTCDGARQGVMAKLDTLRSLGGLQRTQGLPDEVVERFLDRDPTLRTAIDRAFARYEELAADHAEFLRADEEAQVEMTQRRLVNFYGQPLVNPYVALSADGPWIITMKGAGHGFRSEELERRMLCPLALDESWKNQAWPEAVWASRRLRSSAIRFSRSLRRRSLYLPTAGFNSR